MSPLLQIVLIFVLGTLCQIAAWRVSLPSILLLLIAGLACGPVLELLKPDQVFGLTLNPLIELAVAVILFEGGLSLRKAEMGKVGFIVLRLISAAAIATWILLGIASYALLNINFQTASLLGAILVVSGPTVVLPLLRIIRAKSPLEQILRWEGILIDPIGVILAVLIADACELGLGYSAPGHVFFGILVGLGVGLFLGWLGAAVLAWTVGRHTVPDHFVVPLTLTVLFSLVIASNLLHEQSGLLTATVMGLTVARYHQAWVQTIEGFIGHTQRMFIGVLFIILAARLDIDYLAHLDLNLCFFILLAIVVVRPIAVFISTAGTNLKFGEKLAISSLAPRGIVSAALASTLGASLSSSGIQGIEVIVPYTFATIIGTVAFYGLLSPLLFSLYGVRQLANDGVLLVGGGSFALAFANVLHQQGFRIMFVDTNLYNIRRFKKAGLECYHGNALSDGLKEEANLEGIGKLLALTSNDEANSLAAVEFRHAFGAKNVYQLAASHSSAPKLSGRVFVGSDFTWEKMEELWTQGYRPVCQVIDEKGSPPPSGVYILAEIEDAKLSLRADDKLGQLSAPDKRIIFAKQ